MRRTFVHPGQLPFDFTAPLPPTEAGALAGLRRTVAGAVSTMLRGSDRIFVAERTSLLLSEDVSASMLDKYASPASSAHSISAARLFGLAAATGRYDQMDRIALEAGFRVIAGEEFRTVELGHVHAQIAALQVQAAQLATEARPFGGRA